MGRVGFSSVWLANFFADRMPLSLRVFVVVLTLLSSHTWLMRCAHIQFRSVYVNCHRMDAYNVLCVRVQTLHVW